MSTLLGKNWIELINDKIGHLDYGDGKWVAYLPSNIEKKYGNQHNLSNHLDKLINENDLIGGLLRPGKLDVFVVFTNADRHEIWKTKQIISRALFLTSENILWWSNYDSETAWASTTGIKWHISEVIETLERRYMHIKQGDLAKARRLDKHADMLIRKMEKALIMDIIKHRDAMIVKPVFKNLDYQIDPSLVFVLMPFNENWSNATYQLLKDVGLEHNLNVQRADDLLEPSIIMDDIWDMINRAGLLIADITVHNANVFYELGIAHTIGKQVLLIKQRGGERSPFDVGFWRYLEYEAMYDKAEEFKIILRKILKKYIDDNRLMANKRINSDKNF